jgi:ZIP family zinc transporter
VLGLPCGRCYIGRLQPGCPACAGLACPLPTLLHRSPLHHNRKGFFWSFVSGAAEPIGGLIGYALISAGGGVGNPLAFAVSFGFVAGVMVYIAVKELLPTALRYDPEDTFATSGFFGGAAVMAASLLLFKV